MRLAKKIRLLLVACCVLALFPMIFLPYQKLLKETSQYDHGVSSLTSDGAKNLDNDNGTLLPLGAIPPSDHYSFDKNVLTRSFLRNLQNSSRRIIKKWTGKGFNRYDKEDISDCEAVTPECTMHRYLLPRGSLDHEDPNDKPFRKCCVEHKALRETAHWVVRKLVSANITYFLMTGTALGVRRHAGTIIPWDTDVDIAVYPLDNSRVEELFHNNKEHFFERDRFGRDMFWIHHSRNGMPREGPHVEIFYEAIYTDFPHLLLPLEKCTFYGEPVMCPNTKQFDEWFPSSWKVYSGGHYNGPNSCVIHENGQFIRRRRC